MVVVRIDESESAFVLDAYQPFEYVARPAVPGQLPHRIVDRFDVVYRLSGHGRLGDPAFQGLERLRIGPAVFRRAHAGVVITDRYDSSPVPAEVAFPEVVVREFQLPQRFAQRVERREQDRFVLREQRLGELPARKLLQDESRAPLVAQRVGPAHFLRQDAELRQVFGVHAPQDRSRAFDAGQCCGRQGHGCEPPLAAPFDFGFGEPRGAYHARHAVAVGDGAGVGERRQRQVGRQQRTGEVLDGRCHGYSVLTLMEPMLSMVTSWAADAL